MKISEGVLNMLFDGVCDIYRFDDVTDIHGVTRQELKKAEEGVKCRVSFLKAKSAKKSETDTKAQQEVKIFVLKNCDIRCGDIVEVEQHGRREKYKACGQIKEYGSHREVELSIFDESI